MKKNYLIGFDSKCPICNKFVQFLDQTFDETIYSIFVTNSFSHFINTERDFNIISINEAMLLDDYLVKTIVLLKMDGEYEIKSNAVLKILSLSKNIIIKTISKSLILVPLFIRDFIYELFSRNRINISSFLKLNNVCKTNLEHIKLIIK